VSIRWPPAPLQLQERCATDTFGGRKRWPFGQASGGISAISLARHVGLVKLMFEGYPWSSRAFRSEQGVIGRAGHDLCVGYPELGPQQPQLIEDIGDVLAGDGLSGLLDLPDLVDQPGRE
jgi:hypothetical protein